eukprot:COSAG05_NODE_2775_length_2652_cov_2.252252_5_plen_97_part_00
MSTLNLAIKDTVAILSRSAGAQTTPHACDAELSATVFLIYQMVFHNRNSHARMHEKLRYFSESEFLSFMKSQHAWLFFLRMQDLYSVRCVLRVARI